MDKGNCRSCNAEIIWIKTSAGKPMPLDAKPEKLFVYLSGESHPSQSDWQMRDCYRSHFATCPNAASHRKPKAQGD